MILANLWRRKGRTILTLIGISIGIAAIVSLGSMAAGIGAGFTALAQGSQADYVLSQSDALSSLLSRVEVSVGDVLRTWPEVEAIDGVMMSNALLEDGAYLFLFGYDPDGFAIAHFRIVEGQGLNAARGAAGAREMRGHPLLLGRRAAERLGREVGDTIRFEHSTFRIVGIYETGDAFEEGSAVVDLAEAQALTGKPRQVMYYAIKLSDPSRAEELRDTLSAVYPELDFILTAEAAEGMSDFRMMREMIGQISFLVVLIGAVGMLNSMLMSVLERTREIGVLCALWAGAGGGCWA